MQTDKEMVPQRAAPEVVGHAQSRVPPPDGAGDRLFSCDIFDTLLTRSVGRPASLFLLLGKRLQAKGLIRMSPEAFARARLEANRRARVNRGRKLSLTDIYDELQFATGISEADRARIVAEELTLEEELLQPVPGARERLARARDAGMRVRFASDMYMDSRTLGGLLQRKGLHESAGDSHVYVSCEIGCGKEDGRAYQLMAQREGIPSHNILHRGNDPQSDVAGALQAGVKVEPFLDANLNRYEEILETHAFATEGLSSVMAGASRLARLTVQVEAPEAAALRDAAAGVAAPTLVGYVLWLLLQAEKQGIGRLYFMARDGYIMMQIARQLIAKLGLHCEARYLHGGRRAWYLPSIADVSPRDLFWALDYASPDDSVEAFLARLEVEPGEIEAALNELGMPRSMWNRPLPHRQQDVLWSIPNHPAVKKLLLERAAERRQDVLAYFEQEGLFQCSNWAVVDVGWSGRLLGAMNKILKTRGAEIPTAFFFGRFRDRETHSLQHPVRICSYFSDHVQQTGHHGSVYELYVELFCGADHGVTVGYRSVDGAVTPILASEGNDQLREWGLSVVHKTMLSFVDHLWLDPDTLHLAADLRPAVADVLGTFIESPSAAEARAWGRYPFEYGRNGVVAATIATPLTLRQLPQAIRQGSVSTRAGTEWIEAGFALTPRPTRFILKATMALRHRIVARLPFGKPS